MRVNIPSNNFAKSPRGFCVVLALLPILALSWFTSVTQRGTAQTVTVVPAQATSFRVGEKLTYTVSFGKFSNAGYAETNVVSRGKISGKDAIEIRSKAKTVDLVSAAFFMFDESRTVYAAPDTGLPLYISTNSNDSALPKETINNFLTQPATNYDLVTLIFKAREAGGVGTYPLFEGGNNYTASFVTTVPEKVKTEAGDFDTVVSTVQSDYRSFACAPVHTRPEATFLNSSTDMFLPSAAFEVNEL